MCLAYPGEIKSVEGDLAIADFDGIEKEINVSLVDVQKGEYVIVHAGFAIEVVDEKEAKEKRKLFGKEARI